MPVAKPESEPASDDGAHHGHPAGARNEAGQTRLAKEDITVEVEHGVLTIRGEKRSEREEKKERRCHVERTYGTFSRSFSLPADADAERVDARFKDGVLTLELRKSEQAKPKTVDIKT